MTATHLLVRAGVFSAFPAPGLTAIVNGIRRVSNRKLDWAAAQHRAIEIRKMRAAGLTIHAIAADMHVDRSTVSHYLSDKCKAWHRAVQAGKVQP